MRRLLAVLLALFGAQLEAQPYVQLQPGDLVPVYRLAAFGNTYQNLGYQPLSKVVMQ